MRWNVWVFPRSFSVLVQYFRRVLKNLDNEQVRKPISDVFVCKHWSEIAGLPLGELEGNRENFPSWAGKRDRGCLPLTIVFWKLFWKVSGTCLFGLLQLGTTGQLIPGFRIGIRDSWAVSGFRISDSGFLLFHTPRIHGAHLPCCDLTYEAQRREFCWPISTVIFVYWLVYDWHFGFELCNLISCCLPV